MSEVLGQGTLEGRILKFDGFFFGGREQLAILPIENPKHRFIQPVTGACSALSY